MIGAVTSCANRSTGSTSGATYEGQRRAIARGSIWPNTTTNPANVSAFHDDGEPAPVHADHHSGDEQRERNAGACRGEEAMRPLEVGDCRSGAAELSFGPMSQPDATHRAHRHSARREPRDDDERRRSAEDRGVSFFVLRRCHGRQPLEVHALDATPTHSFDDDAESSMRRAISPDLGTRPNSA